MGAKLIVLEGGGGSNGEVGVVHTGLVDRNDVLEHVRVLIHRYEI